MTATERLSDLLPCPFCGNDVSDDEGCFQSGGFTPASVPRWSVRCGNPSCNGETCGVSRAEAVAAWNRRTLDAAPADPVPTETVAIGSKSVVEPTAEHWQRAIEEWEGRMLPSPRKLKQTCDRIEQRARELAQEGE